MAPDSSGRPSLVDVSEDRVEDRPPPVVVGDGEPDPVEPDVARRYVVVPSATDLIVGDVLQITEVDGDLVGVQGNPLLATITGTPGVGNVLTCSGGADDAYQWLRNGTPISGATAKTYTQVQADSEQELSCRRTPSTLRVEVPANPVWEPDAAALFGGQQLVSRRAGVYSQGAVDTSANWNGNSRRAHDSQNEHVLVADAENLRLLWPNDINDQHPPQTIALSTAGTLGGTFEIDITGPVTASTVAIATTATGATLAAALATALGVAASAVTATKSGGANNPSWLIGFSGVISVAPVLTLDTAGLTGTGSTGTVTPIVAATPQVAMGLCDGAGVDADDLDLRALAAPGTSLGNGMSVAVTVPPRSAVFGVPSPAVAADRDDVVLGRISVDRGNDTTTHRFPVQTKQTPEDIPANTGASQNVTGPGVKHAHDSKATWDAYASGRLGFLSTTLLGDPVGGPIGNVLVLGDSIENGSLDSTSVPDPERAYVRRAIKLLADDGMAIAAWSMAQGNETLQNLRATLEDTDNLRRKLLGAGCWSHVFIGHCRNDVQGGRSSAAIIADYEAVVALVRANTPDFTQVYLGTVPPYTDPSNNRLATTVMNELLAWQTGTGVDTADELFDHVFDVGAIAASASDRQRWAHTSLGDPAVRLADGIHLDEQTHADAADELAADPAFWLPFGT